MIKYKTIKDFNIKSINEANTIFKNFLISSSHNKLYKLNKGFNFGVRWSGIKEEFVIDWLTNKSRDIKGVSKEEIDYDNLKSLLIYFNSLKEILEKQNCLKENRIFVFNNNNYNYDNFTFVSLVNLTNRENMFYYFLNISNEFESIFDSKLILKRTLLNINKSYIKEFDLIRKDISNNNLKDYIVEFSNKLCDRFNGNIFCYNFTKNSISYLKKNDIIKKTKTLTNPVDPGGFFVI